ncbi:sphingomyelin phosphodiesterase 5 [Paramormyrops kingsleyae]|uniref:sphingomyelin phosphodiesterase n=1 Tax=Paramormyrops kingsleyae TaxID=1676925 RepID=A0A3B3Q7A8_9TELE|nr:sphingomyelin phosphodiesterase 5-like [Paramormyrops kingsleyae]XP_023680121.1 sphingomyelin phosphodiesterase 5-like [Paramormyrops kingsleyae]XP_023680122.1 sphingomyelin phosphodiesterase 5-like [Paramormyrops kingsleyae]XP_023680123.1 sphingomyelin phosphodiesterase 5-like [Paramormyrops kingsleyae]
MALRESPFPNGLTQGLHAVAWGLILPCFWALDRLIAACRSTTLERAQRAEMECYLHPLKVVFSVILFLVLFLIFAPFALLGFLVWVPLQRIRRPFSYYRRKTEVEDGEGRSGWLQRDDRGTFMFVTANLCLLPDSLARFNNLANTELRAAIIGRRILQAVSRPRIRIVVDSPIISHGLGPSDSLLSQPTPSCYGSVDVRMQSPLAGGTGEDVASDAISKSNSGETMVTMHGENADGFCSSTDMDNGNQAEGHAKPAVQTSDVPWEVSAWFPAHVDFLCLEEVFDKQAAAKLSETLSPVFGHILYDVGVYACWPPGCCTAFKFLNSGLFLASRYPFLQAQYFCFPNGRGEDSLAAKGLLTAKVLIGQNQRQKNVVGYVNCTHLHAPEDDGAIRYEQMDMLTSWIREFQAKTRQADEEVAFDILCGDFNFDNCSPNDALEQKHSVFEDYRDPCRAGPGKEKPWAIGTLLEQPTLYDDDVRTPENLQKTLEWEELRRQYVAAPVPLDGCTLVYPDSGNPWVGRRIDYILYRESTLSRHCHTEVEEFSFVTHLAGLTDHIPVGLRLNVTLNQADN